MDLLILVLIEYSIAIFAIFLGWVKAEARSTRALVARSDIMLNEIRRTKSCT